MLITRVSIISVYLFLQLNISAGIEGCLVRACLEKNTNWSAELDGFLACTIYDLLNLYSRDYIVVMLYVLSSIVNMPHR